ncbi:hypothetical protein H6G74_12735 [Nostoc spongiaeforme FACHB-130]|uniref:Transposase n=1 Tax=Nostoc spongiaeforme FACHB-130 TaxID=1357510 RepID=A0ABR8FV59_9NOSO|nr:hypothetical protein [Nostoc spongiaeforme]MBD2595191.1 hypothetical protein [Nostoc spongiaeforme FACHB-130]
MYAKTAQGDLHESFLSAFICVHLRLIILTEVRTAMEGIENLKTVPYSLA